MLLDFGDLVESLGGRYVTAEDVGTGAEDMAVIAERTAHVVGLPPSAAAPAIRARSRRSGVAGGDACLRARERFGTPRPRRARSVVRDRRSATSATRLAAAAGRRRAPS